MIRQGPLFSPSARRPKRHSLARLRRSATPPSSSTAQSSCATDARALIKSTTCGQEIHCLSPFRYIHALTLAFEYSSCARDRTQTPHNSPYSIRRGYLGCVQSPPLLRSTPPPLGKLRHRSKISADAIQIPPAYTETSSAPEPRHQLVRLREETLPYSSNPSPRHRIHDPRIACNPSSNPTPARRCRQKHWRQFVLLYRRYTVSLFPPAKS